MKIKINTLTTDMFFELYTSVGWEPPCREQVECALKNIAASFVAYEEEKAIGMVRVIGDGGMSFYIKDFAVLPEYQGKGVGQMLLMELQKYLLEHKPEDWAVSLELIGTKEAGMFKMIRNNAI